MQNCSETITKTILRSMLQIACKSVQIFRNLENNMMSNDGLIIERKYGSVSYSFSCIGQNFSKKFVHILGIVTSSYIHSEIS